MIDNVARLESSVRYYSRRFPALFSKANGSWITDSRGREYLDLFAGAGSLNYGHNNPVLIEPILEYIRSGGILNSLDFFTEARFNFMIALEEAILVPRQLDWVIQFPGPTGTNAVEAAMKLARKITGRSRMIAFENGFHGVTLGALAATSNPKLRAAAGVALGNVDFLPFADREGRASDAAFSLIDANRAQGPPAAVIVETVQGEGGLGVASASWLKNLAEACSRVGALLIIDDIQAGCGRTGSFFSFDWLGVTPDIVLLSKSISGIGTPMSLLMYRPELDQWRPGEHNGTFRGNNLAFVGGRAALDNFWTTADLSERVEKRSAAMRTRLEKAISFLRPRSAEVVGRGLMLGIAFTDELNASFCSNLLFEKGVIAETCGHQNQVLKFLPPLTISEPDLNFGLDMIDEAILQVAGN